jgi:CRP-like cAMP-binding protein
MSADNKLKEREKRLDEIGSLVRGESYGVWSLLNNKVILRSMTGVAKTNVKVYYFKREHFFEALSMGLSSSQPAILRVLMNLPVFARLPRYLLLSNISKFKLIKKTFGQSICQEAELAKSVYLIKSGSLKVRKNLKIRSLKKF